MPNLRRRNHVPNYREPNNRIGIYRADEEDEPPRQIMRLNPEPEQVNIFSIYDSKLWATKRNNNSTLFLFRP